MVEGNKAAAIAGTRCAETCERLSRKFRGRVRGLAIETGRPITFGTTDAFLEHYGLATLADLPGMAEMKAAGLLDLNMPSDFALPDPSRPAEDEEPLAEGEVPEFHQDFLGEEE